MQSRPPEEDLERRLPGASQSMRALRDRMLATASLSTPVLIAGEPGTGRDTAVEALYAVSERPGSTLVKIDAREFSPETQLPENATLYLDGIEHLKREAQTFWARRVDPQRGTHSWGGVRLFASVSDPVPPLDCGHFDRVLGRALLHFLIRIPPLRERIQDLPAVAEGAIERIAAAMGRPPARLSRAALNFLAEQRFEGNIRQLEDLLIRALAFSRGHTLRRDLIRDLWVEREESLSKIRAHHSALQRIALLEKLRETGGNVTHTALAFGRSRSAIYRLIAKYGISLSSQRMPGQSATGSARR